MPDGWFERLLIAFAESLDEQAMLRGILGVI
jgi:hypothetical protein